MGNKRCEKTVLRIPLVIEQKRAQISLRYGQIRRHEGGRPEIDVLPGGDVLQQDVDGKVIAVTGGGELRELLIQLREGLLQTRQISLVRQGVKRGHLILPFVAHDRGVLHTLADLRIIFHDQPVAQGQAVESEQGKGTTFTVKLELRSAADHRDIGFIAELVGARALVVDGDQLHCQHASKMLEQIGMRAEWTLSGRDAIARAEEALRIADPFKV